MAEGIELAKAYVQIIPSADGIQGNLTAALTGQATAAGKSAGKSMFGAMLGVEAVKAAAGGLTSFAKSASEVGKEFDASMSQVAATLGYTTEELSDSGSEAAQTFETLRDYARLMGAKTAFSAAEAAEALNYMALAGYDAQTSMKMLPNVLNLAAAGGIELGTASDMITDAQSALGLTLDETTVMVDQMAKASSKSNTSVGQLGDAILTIGGTANIMAGGTERLSTVLGLLADNGIKGSEAGTHLRNMILKLASPTDDGAAAMEALGLSVFDAEGKMRDFQDIFGDLNKAFEGMTDEKKVQYISALFNSRDIASVNALLNTTTERWDELAAAIVDSKDAAGAMADTQLDNLAGDTKILESAMSELKITLSQEMSPIIRDLTQSATGLITDVAGWLKTADIKGTLDAIVGVINDVAGAISPLTDKIIELFSEQEIASGTAEAFHSVWDGVLEVINVASYALADIIQGLADFVNWLSGGSTEAEIFKGVIVAVTAAFVAYQAIQLTLTAVTNGMAIAQGLLNTIMAANPVTIVTLAIVGLVAGIIYLWNNCDAFREFLTGMFDGIVEFFSYLPGFFGEIGEGIVAGWDAVCEFFGSLPGFFVDLGDNIGKAWNDIVDFLSFIPDFFADLINGAFSWGSDMIENFVDGIKSVGSFVTDGVAAVGQGIADFLGFSEPDKGPLSNFHTYAPDMMALFAEGIRDNTDLITDQISDSFNIGSDINAAVSSTVSLGEPAAADAGDIIIPVSIGADRLDTVIVKSQQRMNYRAGGR